MEFEHIGAQRRLMKDHGLNEEAAKSLLQDTMKFLTLASTRPHLVPPPRVDDGWHTLLLFTRDYADICQRHFGRFIHHMPFVDQHTDKKALERTVTLAKMTFGELSSNWDGPGPSPCGSCGTACDGGCTACSG